MIRFNKFTSLRRSKPHARSRGNLRQLRRRSALQSLEPRSLLAGDTVALHNSDSPFDVNADGYVSNTDLFYLVADLRQNGARTTLASAQGGGEGEAAPIPLMLDVNGDNIISNADLFSMVQYLRAEAEGNMLNLNLSVTNNTGTALPGSNINRGETFQLRVSINDMRNISNTANLGAAAAYLDVVFDPLQVTGGPPTTRPFTVGAGWSTAANDQNGSINNTTGIIDEWGGRQDTSSGAATGPGDFFFIAANFKARAALDDSFNVTAGVAQDLSVRTNDPTGTATANFTSNQHETNVLNDFVVWDTGSGGVGPLSLASVFYGSASLNVQQQSVFSITGTTNPTKGTVSIINSGTQIRYTPTVGQTGADSFTYTVTDAQGRTDTATVNINIGTINAVPIVVNDTSATTGGDLSLNEGTTPKVLNYDATIAKLLANDSQGTGDTGQTLSVVKINPFALGNGTYTGSQGGSLVIANFGTPGATMTYTSPSADFNGDDVFTYTIRDNGLSNGQPDFKEATGNFTFTVDAINDAPSFGGVQGTTVTRFENAGAQSITNFATGISAGPANESGQTLSFTVTPANAALFSAGPSISPTGTLTFTPAANANGSTTVTVTLTDSGGTASGGVATSSQQTFTIDLTAINSAPSFTKGSNQFVDENSGEHIVNGWATNISKGGSDESGQTLTFSVSVQTNPGLFSVAPTISPTGTLSYTIAPNTGGSATISVVLQDDGGTANGGVNASAAQTFTINIAEVNDPPTFTAGGSVTVNEDSGAHSSQWATNISPGPGNESSTQTVTFNTVVNSGGSLFAVAPSISSSGVLTFTPASHAFGSATLTVTAVDNGSTGNPGDNNTSAPVNLTINITGINDAPSFTKGANQTVAEDAGAITVTNWATNISAGPNESASQTTGFEILSNSLPTMFSVLPAVQPNGNLTYTLAPNVSGTATISVRIVDNGGTALGGTDASASQQFTITATEVNDAPTGVNDFIDAEETISTTFQAIDILGNDNRGTNEAGQTLRIHQLPATTTGNGTLVLNNDNSFTYTPASGFLGEDTFVYTLIDNGTTNGANEFKTSTATVTITVAPLTVPRARGDNATLNEGDSATISVLANDVVNPNFALNITSFTQPTSGTGSVVLNNDNTFTYTPPADYFGTTEFTYTIDDNDPSTNDGTSTGRVSITVNSVNDRPTFVGGQDVSINEGAGAQNLIGWASSILAGPSNESGQTLSFEIVSNSNSGLFTQLPAISANGNLTFTAGTELFGTAQIVIQLKDNGGIAFGGQDTSQTFTFQINVASVNDAPVFTKGANQTVNEDAAAQSIANWATGISAGPAVNESGQALTFLVSTNNDGLFATLPAVSANGTLTYTLTPHAFGTATVSVQLMDNGATSNGGSDTSAIQTFTITVNAVNDAPSFSLPSDPLVRNRVVAENAGAQNVLGYATNISRGPANESGQALNFVISTSNNGLFSSLPAIDPVTGNLTFTAAANANGSATVTVTLQDDGGTALGGSNSSVSQTFNIVVTEINNPPVANADSGANFVAVSQGGAQTFLPLANDSAGPQNETSQTLRIQSITPVNPPAGGFGTIVIAADGRSFTFNPANTFTTGFATFNYTIVDNGTTNGFADPQTASGTITIEVIQFSPSTISGNVFHDVNSDNQFDQGNTMPENRREHAFGGVEVRLTGADFRGNSVTINTTTAGDGSYLFGNVAPGQYVVTMFEPELTYGGMTTQHPVNITFANDGNTFTEMGAARGLRSEYVNPLDFNSTTPKTGAYVAFHLNNNAPSTQYWYSLLDGWRHFDSLTATISADRSTITVVAVDTGVGTRTATIPTSGDRRFWAYGPAGGSDYSGRIMGTPNEVFGTATSGAGEGEGEGGSISAPAPNTNSLATPNPGTSQTTVVAPAAQRSAGVARFLASSLVVSSGEGESLQTSPAATSESIVVPVAATSPVYANTSSLAAEAVSFADDGSLAGYSEESEAGYAASADEVFATENWL